MVCQEASHRWCRVKDSRSSTNNRHWSIATCIVCRILWCPSHLSVNTLLVICPTSHQWARYTLMIRIFCSSTRLNKHIKRLCFRVWQVNSRISLIKTARLRAEEWVACIASLQVCSGIKFLEHLSLALPHLIRKTTWCNRIWVSHHS